MIVSALRTLEAESVMISQLVEVGTMLAFCESMP